MAQKQLLTNVAIIRPILIVLLVFYHAFAPYSGAWAPIEGFPEIRTYWWLDKLSFAFMLEMFVFISGYVFGYQVRIKGESKLDTKKLLWGKFKRLIIPSMVFSLLYILLLKDITQPLYRTIYDVINGVAHMWFLPMLFWCFVGVWIIEKLHLRSRLVLPILFLSSLFSFVPIPLQLGHTMYYMLFFYIGYIFQRKDICFDKYYSLCNAIVLFAAFIILFPLLTLLKEYMNNLGEGLVIKVISRAFSNLAMLSYSSIGVMMAFVIVGIAEKHPHTLPMWLITVGNLCMGVYLIQQFILMGLYKHTSFPEIFGPFYLPWVGFFIALVGSFLLSYLLNKTKIGRFLIG